MTYQRVTGTLNPGAHPGSYNGQDAYNDMLVVDNAVAVGNGQMCNITMKEIANALDCMHDQQAVLQTLGRSSMDELNKDIAGTLDASYYKGCGERQGVERDVVCMGDRKGHNGVTTDGTATTLTAQEKERPLIGTSVVRRLTPLECTRLQGYPDGWVDIGDWTDSNGKVHKDADTPKYKALGNSIGLPFWQWLARRICAQYERPVTMGSLFDGIGGFPLVFSRCGATPVWASEIEDFCIAVTKKHFPDGD